MKYPTTPRGVPRYSNTPHSVDQLVMTHQQPDYKDLKIWLWQVPEYGWVRLMICIRQPRKAHRMLVITNESVFPLSQHVFEREVKSRRTELDVSDRWKQYLWLQYTEKGAEAVREALQVLWEGGADRAPKAPHGGGVGA